MTDYSDDDNDFEDTEAFKLYRHTDPHTSKEAAFLLDTHKARKFVLQVVKEAGIDGLTIPEMQRKYPRFTGGTISSRPNELKKEGKIFYTGETRAPFNGEGRQAQIMRAAKYKKHFREDGTRCFPTGNPRSELNKK